MAQHTPGPWSVGDWSALGEDISEVSLIRLDGGKLDVCYVAGQDDEAEANARHIVECVNEREPGGAVDALIEAVRGLLWKLERKELGPRDGPPFTWARVDKRDAAVKQLATVLEDLDRKPQTVEDCAACFENGLVVPATALLPTSLDLGVTVLFVPACNDHRSTWWEGADWDGRHLERDLDELDRKPQMVERSDRRNEANDPRGEPSRPGESYWDWYLRAQRRAAQ